MIKKSDLVIIDGGHAVVGAVGARGNGLKEEVEARKVVKDLDEKLREKGYKTKIVSVDSEKDEKKQRHEVARKANAANGNKKDGAIFLSCHLNSHSNPTANGVECWIYPGSKSGRKIANAIQGELVKGIKWTNRGVKEAEWTVLAETKMPGVLIELGFIGFKEDMKKFNVDKITNAIFKAITGTEYKKPVAPPPVAEKPKKLIKVQVGAFGIKKNADNLAEELKKKGHKPFIKSKKNATGQLIYKVQVGAFSKRENATNLENVLKKQGYKTYIIEE